MFSCAVCIHWRQGPSEWPKPGWLLRATGIIVQHLVFTYILRIREPSTIGQSYLLRKRKIACSVSLEVSTCGWVVCKWISDSNMNSTSLNTHLLQCVIQLMRFNPQIISRLKENLLKWVTRASKHTNRNGLFVFYRVNCLLCVSLDPYLPFRPTVECRP